MIASILTMLMKAVCDTIPGTCMCIIILFMLLHNNVLAAEAFSSGVHEYKDVAYYYSC
jgi:putative effector of murein hydrolase LrgA (UPF0299 family)